ncbi:MAG: DUF512 domain-containing protein [Gemmatimonadota bacterium]|nr:DUF512 domain-containing protein [Gemmatimonadota bacterium]
MIRILRVRPGSIADELGLSPGALVLRINDSEVRDGLDLRFLEADAELVVLVRRAGGEEVLFDIEKDPDESLGIVPEPDKVRRCTNACPFCFVKGNPRAEKLRAGLYIKDDDYRLSFQFGHYVTLTNLRDEDWERIFAQRLSPLYVSVHATDPEARLAMLVNPRAARIGEHLDRLGEGGIRVHAQVVLCPGLNDGTVLERTIDDLYARGEAILSLSVVPVGLTSYNRDRGVRQLTPEECHRALDRIEAVRRRAKRERGHGWCYAADELFLQAGLEVPGRAYFDEGELTANGVGAISELLDLARRDLPDLPRLPDRRIVLVTGTSMGPHLARLADEIADVTGARLDVAATENGLYGPLVTTAGLLSGADHAAALRRHPEFELGLFSRAALNDDEAFLDDVTLAGLRAGFPGREIWPAEHVTDALRALSA